MHLQINGLVVIRLSIKVYNPATAGSTLNCLVISAGHASARGLDPWSIPPPGAILLIAEDYL
jgi:hypothetical protein